MVAALRPVSVKEVVLAPTVPISVKFVSVTGLRSILKPDSLSELSLQERLTLFGRTDEIVSPDGAFGALSRVLADFSYE